MPGWAVAVLFFSLFSRKYGGEAFQFLCSINSIWKREVVWLGFSCGMARLVLTVCDQITCNDFCLCSECSKLKGMESKVFSEFALKKMIELFQYPSKALIPTNLSSPRFFGIAEEKMSINPGNYKLSDKTGKLTAQGNQFFIIFSVSYVFIGASESRYSKRKPAFRFYEVRSCFIKYV